MRFTWPFAGILERLDIYATMLWILVFAVTLLQAGMSEAAVRSAAVPALAQSATP